MDDMPTRDFVEDDFLTTKPSYYSTHDPACDPCRSKKIRCGRQRPQCLNCRRNKLECTFSGRSKRTHQSQKVIDNISELSGRLGSVEDSIQSLTGILQNRLPLREASHSISTPRSSDKENANTEHHYHEEAGFWLANGSIGKSYELYYGPTSLHAYHRLLEQTIPDLKNSRHVDDDFVGHVREVLAKWTSFARHDSETIILPADHLSERQTHDVRSSNGLQLPPKGLLLASYKIYFGKVHWRWPFLSAKTCMDQLNLAYNSPNTYGDAANVIIFYFIVVPRLLETLLTPHLTNIQALIALYIVALDYHHPSSSDVLLSTVVASCRSAGLHRQQRHPRRQQEKEHSARSDVEVNVLRTVFTLDKTHSHLFGKMCLLPLSDICVPDVKSSEDETEAQHEFFVARARLSKIEDKIYRYAVSPSKLSNSDEMRLDHEFDQWAKTYLPNWPDLSKPTSSWQPALAQLELRLLYHASLATYHGHRVTASLSGVTLKHCKAVVGVIQTAAANWPSGLPAAVLSRSVSTLPSMSLLSIPLNLLRQPPKSSDLDLVLMACSAADFLQHTSICHTQSGAYRAHLVMIAQDLRRLVMRVVETTNTPPPSGQATPRFSHAVPSLDSCTFDNISEDIRIGDIYARKKRKYSDSGYMSPELMPAASLPEGRYGGTSKKQRPNTSRSNMHLGSSSQTGNTPRTERYTPPNPYFDFFDVPYGSDCALFQPGDDLDYMMTSMTGKAPEN